MFLICSKETIGIVHASELKEEEKQGRKTGSVEWRLARGELGNPREQIASQLPASTKPTINSSASTSSSSSSVSKSDTSSAPTVQATVAAESKSSTAIKSPNEVTKI